MKPIDSAASADFSVPATVQVPVLAAHAAGELTNRSAFRQAILAVENLREQLREVRSTQAEARRRYWQQVGPVASAVVAARRALFPALEEALLLGYFTRLEERQITEVIVGNAKALEERFGEDETVILSKYAPAHPHSVAPADATATPAASPEPAFIPDPSLPLHEQAAAAARARRKTKAQRAAETAAEAARAEQQQLETNTKTLYRQLARTHHPDLERDPTKQALKTTQMQRITAAYEADDLYALLQLLSESSPADAEADDVLARYTRALVQQQIALNQEINEAKQGATVFQGASTKRQEHELRQIKRDLRAEADYVQQVSRLTSEPTGLREILRQLLAEGLATI